MVGWHHQLNGHKVEQTPGDDEGQGGLACCSPWGCKVSDMTGQLNNNNMVVLFLVFKGILYCSAYWLYQFTVPPPIQEDSPFSTYSPAFIVCRFF